MARLSFDFVKQEIEDLGYILLEQDYINDSTKMRVLCPEGHPILKSRNGLKHRKGKGNGCPVCQRLNAKKDVDSCATVDLTYGSLIDSIHKNGYTLLNKPDLTGNASKILKEKLNLICPNKHSYLVTVRSWLRGCRCTKCLARSYARSIEDIKKEIEREGYKLLTETYLNAHQKLDLICNNGHSCKISWNKWTQRKRCCYCAHNAPINPEDVKKSFELEGYILLSPYTNSSNLMDYICNNEHQDSMSWDNWKQGKRCPSCAKRYTKEEVQKILDSDNNGFKCTGILYPKKGPTLFSLLCPTGHSFDRETSWLRYKSCPVCFNEGKSAGEAIIKNFLDRINIIHDRNVRNIISPLELDFVIPELNLAIEYDGLYWHAEVANNHNKSRRIRKLKACQDAGLRLITIFEDELLNQSDIVLSRLRTILRKPTAFKLYARDCEIKEITQKETSVFLNKFHLQAAGQSIIKLGAFYGDFLVSVMTFSNPNISKNQRSPLQELNRFCMHSDFCIPGVASKLLSFFEKNYPWETLISFADRRWSDGNLYNRLGFSFVHYTPPNYWYLTKDYKKRISRFSLRKTEEDDPNLTEWENRQLQGWDRIWDSGSLKFIKYKGGNNR